MAFSLTILIPKNLGGFAESASANGEAMNRKNVKKAAIIRFIT